MKGLEKEKKSRRDARILAIGLLVGFIMIYIVCPIVFLLEVLGVI